MRSANASRPALIASSLLLLSGLCGCVETTQQKNARARVRAERVLASQELVHVTRPNPTVAVVNVALLHGNGAAAIAVVLRNDASIPTSDLPISVGITSNDGHRVYLNSKPELPYFQTHIGAIAGGDTVTWVFANPTNIASSASPFATVGTSTLSIGAGVNRLPSVTGTAASTSDSASARALVKATVTNSSGVPQYGLAAYAYAVSGDRVLAAGYAPVGDLQPGSSTTVPVTLIGSPGRATVQVDAPPTILR